MKQRRRRPTTEQGQRGSPVQARAEEEIDTGRGAVGRQVEHQIDELTFVPAQPAGRAATGRSAIAGDAWRALHGRPAARAVRRRRRLRRCGSREYRSRRRVRQRPSPRSGRVPTPRRQWQGRRRMSPCSARRECLREQLVRGRSSADRRASLSMPRRDRRRSIAHPAIGREREAMSASLSEVRHDR